MATFWNKRTEQAALDVALDAQTDTQIAASLKISKRTLENWKARPEFAARVAVHVERFAAAIQRQGIAHRSNRVKAQNDRWERMQRIIDERARVYGADPDAAPGVETGLMVRQEKMIGGGEAAEHVVEWKVDDGLLGELRQIEMLSAKELGQWTEKRDVTSGGQPLTFTIAIDRREAGEEGADGAGDRS